MNMNNLNNKTNLGNPELQSFDRERFGGVQKKRKLPGQVLLNKQRTAEFLRRMDKIFDRDKLPR